MADYPPLLTRNASSFSQVPKPRRSTSVHSAARATNPEPAAPSGPLQMLRTSQFSAQTSRASQRTRVPPEGGKGGGCHRMPGCAMGWAIVRKGSAGRWLCGSRRGARRRGPTPCSPAAPLWPWPSPAAHLPSGSRAWSLPCPPRVAWHPPRVSRPLLSAPRWARGGLPAGGA